MSDGLCTKKQVWFSMFIQTALQTLPGGFKFFPTFQQYLHKDPHKRSTIREKIRERAKQRYQRKKGEIVDCRLFSRRPYISSAILRSFSQQQHDEFGRIYV